MQDAFSTPASTTHQKEKHYAALTYHTTFLQNGYTLFSNSPLKMHSRFVNVVPLIFTHRVPPSVCISNARRLPQLFVQGKSSPIPAFFIFVFAKLENEISMHNTTTVNRCVRVRKSFVNYCSLSSRSFNRKMLRNFCVTVNITYHFPDHGGESII